MTDINPTPSWANVRQLETNEFATGGANGNMNEQAKSLAARSELLKQYAALPYESKTGGYALNERVTLNNGDIVRSTIASNVNNPNENMTGWVETNDASQIFDVGGRNQQEINDDDLRLKDYAKYKVGNDWTAAMQKADNDAIAQSKCVNVAGGTYNYSGNITLSGHWFGSGLHNTRFRKTAPATITMLNGSIRDLAISPDTLITGDTTHGLVADGVDRKYIENVLTEKHGGDGFVYKRGNLSRFFLRSRSNGGRGVTFANDIISGDNKACEVWFECTANKKSGFFMENSATTSQNSGQHRGFIIAQSNGSDATVDDNYNAVLSGNYNNLQLYTEYVGGVWHKPSLKGSNIYYSNISHPLFRDEADNSSIVSGIPSANGTRDTIDQIFRKITIWNQNKPFSGRFSLSHKASNTLLLEADLSGAQQFLEFGSNITLRGVGNSYQFAKVLTGGATLNFSSIPAQGSVERTVTVGGAVTSLQTGCVATPAGNIGENLVWSCYVSAFNSVANTTTVTVRVANPAVAAITSTQLAWRVKVFPE